MWTDKFIAQILKILLPPPPVSLKVQDISDIRKFIGYSEAKSFPVRKVCCVRMHLFEKIEKKWPKFPEESSPSPIRTAELSTDS